jgi:hypothetical protein
MSDIFSTKVVVLRETSAMLTVMCEDSVSYSNISPRYGLIAKREPIKINKRHILEGSDNLGRPENDEKETNGPCVAKGTLIIPLWLAIQKGLWKRGSPSPKEGGKEDGAMAK